MRLVDVIGRDGLSLDRLREHSIDPFDEQTDATRLNIVTATLDENSLDVSAWVLRRTAEGETEFANPVRTLTITTGGGSIVDMRVADLNADGRLDVLGSYVGREDNLYVVARQNEDGAFSGRDPLLPSLPGYTEAWREAEW